MKKALHQPPPEIREALAMRPEKRARKRNEHSKPESWGVLYDRAFGGPERRANRRAHRIPLPA